VDPALQAAATYSSLGSGLETFRQAFQTFERDSATGARNVIIHHAHNDYLELWVEAGWPVVPCAILLLGALAYAGLRSLRHQSDSQRMPRRAAMIALLVPIVHSLFDYPLRTTSHVVAFGLLAGIVAMTEVTQYKRTQSAQSGY
jgi:O-antigen ligase